MTKRSSVFLFLVLIVVPGFLFAAETDLPEDSYSDYPVTDEYPFDNSLDQMQSTDMYSEDPTGDFDILNVSSSLTDADNPFGEIGFGGQNGQRQGRAFHGFFLADQSYELAMLALGKEGGFLRIGSRKYQLAQVTLNQTQQTDTNQSTIAEGERQVVAQFQAVLVTIGTDSADSSSAVGTIQGVIVRHGAPERNVQVQNRPRPRIVIEASVQTSDVSGTILGLGRHHGQRGGQGKGGRNGRRRRRGRRGRRGQGRRGGRNDEFTAPFEMN